MTKRVPRQSSGLPFVFINAAPSADGKLASSEGGFIRFSSDRDQQRLLVLRARADAVMTGARTAEAFDIDLSARKVKGRPRPRGLDYLRVIVSGSGSLDPKAKIFQKRFSPIIVLTSERASRKRVRELQRVADAVEVIGRKEIDFVRALRWLKKKWHVRRLLSEGGGEMNAALFKAGLVSEVYLTVCPIIIGGRRSSAVVEGPGVRSLAEAPRLKLTTCQRAGDELFLVYRVLSRTAVRRHIGKGKG